jgi:cyanophycinase
VPMGGTSAGLAVLGEYAYSAQGDAPKDPNLDAKTAFADPFGARITVTKGLVTIPVMKAIITDTHFARRDRMGRLLVFLARLKEDGKHVRGIGVEQGAAVLLGPDGAAKVVGNGSAYFVDAGGASGKVAKGVAFTYGPFQVEKVGPGYTFNVKSWSGEATHYSLSVESGVLHSTQANGAVY